MSNMDVNSQVRSYGADQIRSKELEGGMTEVTFGTITIDGETYEVSVIVDAENFKGFDKLGSDLSNNYLPKIQNIFSEASKSFEENQTSTHRNEVKDLRIAIGEDRKITMVNGDESVSNITTATNEAFHELQKYFIPEDQRARSSGALQGGAQLKLTKQQSETKSVAENENGPEETASQLGRGDLMDALGDVVGSNQQEKVEEEGHSSAPANPKNSRFKKAGRTVTNLLRAGRRDGFQQLEENNTQESEVVNDSVNLKNTSETGEKTFGEIADVASRRSSAGKAAKKFKKLLKKKGQNISQGASELADKAGAAISDMASKASDGLANIKEQAEQKLANTKGQGESESLLNQGVDEHDSSYDPDFPEPEPTSKREASGGMQAIGKNIIKAKRALGKARKAISERRGNALDELANKAKAEADTTIDLDSNSVIQEDNDPEVANSSSSASGFQELGTNRPPRNMKSALRSLKKKTKKVRKRASEAADKAGAAISDMASKASDGLANIKEQAEQKLANTKGQGESESLLNQGVDEHDSSYDPDYPEPEPTSKREASGGMQAIGKSIIKAKRALGKARKAISEKRSNSLDELETKAKAEIESTIDLDAQVQDLDGEASIKEKTAESRPGRAARQMARKASHAAGSAGDAVRQKISKYKKTFVQNSRMSRIRNTPAENRANTFFNLGSKVKKALRNRSGDYSTPLTSLDLSNNNDATVKLLNDFTDSADELLSDMGDAPKNYKQMAFSALSQQVRALLRQIGQSGANQNSPGVKGITEKLKSLSSKISTQSGAHKKLLSDMRTKRRQQNNGID